MLMVIPAIACVVICIYIYIGNTCSWIRKKCMCFGQSSFWKKNEHAHPPIKFQCLLLQPYFSCMCFPRHDAHDPFDHEDCCGILKLLWDDSKLIIAVFKDSLW